MLKVGDKVKVREDLIYDRNEPGVTDVMLGFRGKEMTIKEVIKDREYYIFLEDEAEHYWTEEMFEKIEEKESNNMKIEEMTLNEILNSILKGKLEMEEFNKQFETFCYEKGMEILTKQFKRPQYTFQEAFKAFEEGKEIESCESGFKYEIYEDATKIKREGYKTIYEHKAVKIFSTEEIKGKWYIND
ncbi:hypothetical protein F391_gp52 [Clostridium phage phiCP34O]|uniref:hypothetical protein n=2 Tax=unclassified Caudoviricetes TaxID=2788787 RepID=UPI000214C760|nr:hypothetical protein F391_gp52 [Clostridium phage phiCP34O]AEI74533.1 hypothetical protein phi34O_gp52 [Clostridium phage phiCP34O]